MNEKFVLEALPDRLQAKIEKKERDKRNNLPGYINGNALELVLDDLKLWRVGTLTVSFKGGDTALHEKIAQTASLWTQHGNLKFDFGYDESSGNYRTWTPGDKSHIRVGFEYEGYWSLVGNDSSDTALVEPGEITLNLANFDQNLPRDWQATTLHEFGHALGFHHEHQSPSTTCDFNWPLLYDYLGGAPNYWPKSKVDHNMRQLQEGSISYSAHDSDSIMHYSFPAWMFITEKESPCFTEQNLELSEEDKRMMQNAYPEDEQLVQTRDHQRIKSLEELLSKSTKDDLVTTFRRNHLDYYKKVSV